MGTLPHLIIISICTFLICIVQTDSRPFVNHIGRYHGPFWQNAINNQWHHPFGNRHIMEPPSPDSRKGFGRPFGLINSMSSMSSSLPSLGSRPQLGLTSGHGLGTLTTGWSPGSVAAQIPSLQLGQTMQVGGTASVSSSHLEQMHLVGDKLNPAMANVVFGSGSQYSFTGDSIQQTVNGTDAVQSSSGNIDGGGSQIYQIATMGEVNEVTVMGDSDATGSGTVVQQSFSDSGPADSSDQLGATNSAEDEEPSEPLSELLLLEQNNEGATSSLSSDPVLELSEEAELNLGNANIEMDADMAESSDIQQGQVESDALVELEEPLLQTSDSVEVPPSPNQPLEVVSNEAPAPVGISHGSVSSLQQPLQSATLSVIFTQTDDGDGSPVLAEQVNDSDMKPISQSDIPVPQNEVPSVANAVVLEESSSQNEDKPNEPYPNEEDLLTAVELDSQPEMEIPEIEVVQQILTENIPEQVPPVGSSLEPSLEHQDEISDGVQLTSSSQESAGAVETEAIEEVPEQGDNSEVEEGQITVDKPAPIYLLMPLEQLLPVLETLEDQQEQGEIEDDEAVENEDAVEDMNDSEENGNNAIFSEDNPLLTPLDIPSPQEELLLPEGTPMLDTIDPQQENIIFSQDKPLTPIEIPVPQEELLLPPTPILETNENGPQQEDMILLSEDKPVPIEDSIPSMVTGENQSEEQVDFIDILSSQDQPLTSADILPSEEMPQSPSDTIIIDPHQAETVATHVTSNHEDVGPILSTVVEADESAETLSISLLIPSEQLESQNILLSPDLPDEVENDPILTENSPVEIPQILTIPEQESSSVQIEQHQDFVPQTQEAQIIPNLEVNSPSESQSDELLTSNLHNSHSTSNSVPQEQNESEIELDLEELQEIISQMEPDPNNNQVDDDLEPIITTLNDYLLELQQAEEAEGSSSEEETPQVSDSSATYLMEEEVESEPPKGQQHLPEHLAGKPAQQIFLPLEMLTPPNRKHEVILSSPPAAESNPIEDFDTSEDDLAIES